MDDRFFSSRRIQSLAAKGGSTKKGRTSRLRGRPVFPGRKSFGSTRADSLNLRQFQRSLSGLNAPKQSEASLNAPSTPISMLEMSSARDSCSICVCSAVCVLCTRAASYVHVLSLTGVFFTGCFNRNGWYATNKTPASDSMAKPNSCQI